jgi:DNA-binding NarL/FixJ family response regulator
MEEKTGLTVNALTGEEVLAPLTQEELDFIELTKKQAEKVNAEIESKASARQSALAKLAALGLTEEEIAAL